MRNPAQRGGGPVRLRCCRAASRSGPGRARSPAADLRGLGDAERVGRLGGRPAALDGVRGGVVRRGVVRRAHRRAAVRGRRRLDDERRVLPLLLVLDGVLLLELAEVVEDDEDAGCGEELASALIKFIVGGRTELEAPDDDEDDDDDDADDVVARVAEPVLDIPSVTRRVAGALVDSAVLTAVEERPDKVDADGDDQQRVDSHCVCVEADAAVLARERADEANREWLVGKDGERERRGVPDDSDQGEPGVGQRDEPQTELLVGAQVEVAIDYAALH